MIAAHAKAEARIDRLAKQAASAKADAEASQAQEAASATTLKAYQAVEAALQI